MEEVAKFGAGVNSSFFHPFGLIALIIAIILIFALPRKHIAVIILSFLILLPSGQNFYFLGVHFFLKRILILFGFIRVAYITSSNKNYSFIHNFNSIDKYFMLYMLIRAIAFILQFREMGAIVYQIGFIWDSSCYFLLRSLVIDNDDVNRVIKCILFLYAFLSISMLVENVYMVNIFQYIGGPSELDIREGNVRSFGSFKHPLTAGASGAAFMPIFCYLWYQNKNKKLALIGLISSTIMTFTAHSSGPLLAYFGGIFALLLWFQRKSMVVLRWFAMLSILLLHLIMKAPVWFLITRIDLTGSSSSYHRAILIDQFIKHFWDWWLIGTPDHYSWGYFLWDVQNFYVSVGVEGGLGALICFLAIMLTIYSKIGKIINLNLDKINKKIIWVFGSSLFAYSIAFIGVNLFDQSSVIWYLLLSIISAYMYSYYPFIFQKGSQIR